MKIAKSQLQNGANILPSRISNTYITHTDRYQDVEKLKNSQKSGRHGFNELLSDFGADVFSNEKAFIEVIRRRDFDPKKLILIAVGRNEASIMPAFLDHYRSLGIDQFAIVDNCSTDGSLDYLLNQDDIFAFSTPNNYSEAKYGVSWQKIVMDYFSSTEHFIVVDFDEFLISEDLPNLSLNEKLSDFKQDFTSVLMVDFYAGPNSTTSLDHMPQTSSQMFECYGYHDERPFEKTHNFSRQNNMPIYTNLLRQRLATTVDWKRFAAQKGIIFKNRACITPSIGLHDINGQHDDLGFYIAHFKFTAGFEDKVKDEVKRAEHWNKAEEYKEYLSRIEAFSSPFSHAYSVEFDRKTFFKNMDLLK